MAKLSPILNLARELLTLPAEAGQSDLWLWEHSERVMRIAELLAQAPETAAQRPNAQALSIAALFHDAGWAIQVRGGQISRWQVLNRPTSDIQRELGAAYLDEHAHRHVQADVLRLAVESIRLANDRHSGLIEAQIIAEAENLDEIGLLYTLRQFRQYQAEGRPLEQLLTSWQRQQQYRFWETRVNDTLRFEQSRRLARERLIAVEQMMQNLARLLDASDVRSALLGADAKSADAKTAEPRSGDSKTGDGTPSVA